MMIILNYLKFNKTVKSSLQYEVWKVGSAVQLVYSW